ncbi:unnamed protein product [Hymenolepis diminuta]|uniref:Coiled-coil domain-containing protein 149 n=1 Tax=Hymenolepis diminuta TaxID=6216 RepID=A0A158QE98_HYMDI|nr:unnamed protein product [Hymenolepis diminuta]
MKHMSLKKELMKNELSNLRNEVLLLKQEFVNNRHNVDEYCHSRFHDDLSILNAKKRSIHNLILATLAASASSRESRSRYPSELKSLLRQLNAVEADLQEMLTSLNTKDPLEHADGAIKDTHVVVTPLSYINKEKQNCTSVTTVNVIVCEVSWHGLNAHPLDGMDNLANKEGVKSLTFSAMESS